MVYETFLETIHSLVQDRLGSQAQVSLRHVLKNNGLLLDGLSITSPDSSFAPTVYLNSYYEEAEDGLPLSIIRDQILLLYEEESGLPPELADQLQHLECIRDRIAFKLIHAEDNSVLLSQIPHFRYLDLAVVYYIIVSENEDGQMTALVHNEHLDIWNVTKEELSQIAEENTSRLLPCRIYPIEEAIMALEEDGSPDDTALTPINLFVLSNEKGINGASCLLYPDVLKNFADQLEDDLIILPSSIHEVLLVPFTKALSFDELNEMITCINKSDVPAEDRLSDHLYCYSREQNCVYLPGDHSGFSNSSEQDGTLNPQ